jgi:3-dehydroquinate dehydratase type I
MRPYRKGKYSARICIPIVETNAQRALRDMEEASDLADLIELRVDYLRDPTLEPFLAKARKPLIITNRRRDEGGKYAGDEEERLAILAAAADSGAGFIDVEIKTQCPFLEELFRRKKKTRFILSSHDFQKTPSPRELRNLCGRMMGWKTDVVKIVTLARTFEDNLRIFSLLPYARERGQEIVAFCMGGKGKMSRIFAPLMGAAWTYASLSEEKASASGQLTARELKKVWERLG